MLMIRKAIPPAVSCRIHNCTDDDRDGRRYRGDPQCYLADQPEKPVGVPAVQRGDHGVFQRHLVGDPVGIRVVCCRCDRSSRNSLQSGQWTCYPSSMPPLFPGRRPGSRMKRRYTHAFGGVPQKCASDGTGTGRMPVPFRPDLDMTGPAELTDRTERLERTMRRASHPSLW